MRCVRYFINICITFLEINKHLKKPSKNALLDHQKCPLKLPLKVCFRWFLRLLMYEMALNLILSVIDAAKSWIQLCHDLFQICKMSPITKINVRQYKYFSGKCLHLSSFSIFQVSNKCLFTCLCEIFWRQSMRNIFLHDRSKLPLSRQNIIKFYDLCQKLHWHAQGSTIQTKTDKIMFEN